MKKMIVANLKMNFTRDEMLDYINNIKCKISDNLDVIICPSFLYLHMFEKQDYKLGAQNMFYLDSGPYTGEISPLQLKSLGVSYVILGHSERRINFFEDDITINKKIKSALKHNLKPILCIGETIEEKQLRKTSQVIKQQLLYCLKDITKEEISDIVIAYEPVWAIGSGMTPTIGEIEDAIMYIKNIIKNRYDVDIIVLYGGSVSKDNIKAIVSARNVAGALIGTSSVDVKYFADMLDIID
jgi:triosephosphate isomerase (TIM)